jgi:leucyl aminopeptidase (aminopeptidase T)
MVAMTRIESAALAAVSDCLRLHEGERFLIVTNPDTEQEVIAQALKTAAEAQGIHATLLLQPIKNQGEYAENYVLEAIASKPTAFASISTEKLGKDPKSLSSPIQAPDGKKYDHIFHYLLHGTKEMRAFWSPGITVDMFERTIAIDYSLMRKRAANLVTHMNKAVQIRVTSPSGTDITIGTLGRKTFVDDGDFGTLGRGGNLPAGEVFISPALRTAEGDIVFDGSIADIAGDIVIGTPIRCSVLGGYVLDVQGGEEARRLEKALRHGMDLASDLVKKGTPGEEALRYATNSRNIGELGIGLNTSAIIKGNMLEDEKVYGTCHFAIGSNYDEDAPAMIHLDGLVKKPSITALMGDGKEVTLMLNGALV